MGGHRSPSSSLPEAASSTMVALTDHATLDAHMLNASYVEGNTPTQKDVALFLSVSKPPASFPHALRWYSHIDSFSAATIASLPGTPATPIPPPETAPKPAPAPAPATSSEPESKKEKKEKKKEEKEKLLKKVIKEGGKKGVEIEGASDMGGLEFFCTTIESPDGELELLQLAMTAMNAQPEEGAEERKGCSGHVGKMIFSAGVKQLAIVAYVPADKLEKVDI